LSRTAEQRIPHSRTPEVTSTLITHRFPIEDAVEAFRLAQDKSKGVFRVVVEP
jgi:threonine dehydrogenase-like Zn-dependent dehydrogenase